MRWRAGERRPSWRLASTSRDGGARCVVFGWSSPQAPRDRGKRLRHRRHPSRPPRRTMDHRQTRSAVQTRRSPRPWPARSSTCCVSRPITRARPCWTSPRTRALRDSPYSTARTAACCRPSGSRTGTPRKDRAPTATRRCSPTFPTATPAASACTGRLRRMSARCGLVARCAWMASRPRTRMPDRDSSSSTRPGTWSRNRGKGKAGRPGLSDGCFVFSKADRDVVISSLQGGALIYAIYEKP